MQRCKPHPDKYLKRSLRFAGMRRPFPRVPPVYKPTVCVIEDTARLLCTVLDRMRRDIALEHRTNYCNRCLFHILHRKQQFPLPRTYRQMHRERRKVDRLHSHSWIGRLDCIAWPFRAEHNGSYCSRNQGHSGIEGCTHHEYRHLDHIHLRYMLHPRPCEVSQLACQVPVRYRQSHRSFASQVHSNDIPVSMRLAVGTFA
jgi:hypothetical protein